MNCCIILIGILMNINLFTTHYNENSRIIRNQMYSKLVSKQCCSISILTNEFDLRTQLPLNHNLFQECKLRTFFGFDSHADGNLVGLLVGWRP